MTDYRVSAQEIQTYDPTEVRSQMIETLEPLGSIEAFVKKGQTVLLKPNFVKSMDPERGGLTHPVVIAEMARLCVEAGAAKVLIGDSPAFGSCHNVAKKMGLLEMIKDMPVEIIEFRTVHKQKEGLENGTFSYISQAGELNKVDVLINLAKAKAHCQMVMTCATKNLFGCVPGRKKALMHCLVKNSRYLFGRMLVDNARTLKPTLNFVDGVVAMQGQGPTSGTPYRWGWFVASSDFIATDHVLAGALGYTIEELPHLKAARDMNIGPSGLEEIELIGSTIEAMHAEKFQKANLLPITFNPVRLVIGYVKHLRQMRTRPAD